VGPQLGVRWGEVWRCSGPAPQTTERIDTSFPATCITSLTGARTRYTVLRIDKVLELVGAGGHEQFARDNAAALEEVIDRGGLRREPHWSEAIAVGSREYVAAIDDQIKGRIRTKTSESQDGSWSVREPGMAYGQNPGTKIEHKRGVWVLNWA